MSKETMIKRVRAALEKDPRINLHRYPISVAAQNGDLILTGEVESIAAKKLALVTASETHGVERIVDRLKVTPGEEMGDAEIRDHVCKVLFEEPALEHCSIHGFVGNHVATEKAMGEAAGSIVVTVSDGVVTPQRGSAESNAQAPRGRPRLVGAGDSRCCQRFGRSASGRR